MIIDSHAHLDMPQFDSDRDAVIQRARTAGVDMLIIIGTGSPQGISIDKTLELADRHDFIWAGLGISPHDARLADDSYLNTLEAMSRHPKVVLWGEIGLDYYHDLSPRKVQREVLRSQLRIARKRQLPVALHCRDAWQDLMSIMREEYAGADRGAMLHSFTGTRDQALEAAALGYFISFSGIITFQNAAALREAAQALDPSQVLVETDCPYLAPVPHRGKRNEPAFVLDTARALAQIQGVDFDVLARETSANVRRLLRFSEAGAEA
jgi:TatD DNase family protein